MLTFLYQWFDKAMSIRKRWLYCNSEKAYPYRTLKTRSQTELLHSSIKTRLVTATAAAADVDSLHRQPSTVHSQLPCRP